MSCGGTGKVWVCGTPRCDGVNHRDMCGTTLCPGCPECPCEDCYEGLVDTNTDTGRGNAGEPAAETCPTCHGSERKEREG